MNEVKETQRKYSKKREAILDALKKSRDHPSAEMLYAELKPQYHDLSLGTVYRNLAFFVESGEVICVGNVAGQDRYDADISSHAHFICRSCNSVLDINLDNNISSLYGSVESQVGAHVDGHRLLFRGRCSECCAKRGN